MNYRKETILNLAGAEGEIKAVITPLSFNIYQNGKKVKKKGSFKPLYPIQTTSGTVEPIRLINGTGRVRTAIFRDQQIPLEEKLSTLDYIIGMGIFCLVFIFGCAFIGYTTGVIGGALIGAMVAIGIMLNFGFLRNEQNVMSKVIIATGVSVGCYIIYFVLGLMATVLLRSVVYGLI